MSVSQAAQWHTGLPNIGHRTLLKIWIVFCMDCTSHGNDFELILTVKMETGHSVDGSFNSEFPA